MTDAHSWQLFLYFAGLLSAWSLVIIATMRWTLSGTRAVDDKRLAQIETEIQAAKTANQEREREILQLRCDLPLEYVRREDAIRQETVMTAKLDALAAKIDALRAENRRNP